MIVSIFIFTDLALVAANLAGGWLVNRRLERFLSHAQFGITNMGNHPLDVSKVAPNVEELKRDYLICHHGHRMPVTLHHEQLVEDARRRIAISSYFANKKLEGDQWEIKLIQILPRV